MRGRVSLRAAEESADVAAASGRLVEQEWRYGVFMSGACQRLFPHQRQLLFETLLCRFIGNIRHPVSRVQ